MKTAATVAVLPTGHTTLELVDVTLEPRPHEVVVRLTATGVCHSQLDQIDHPSRFGAAAGTPVVMGHEAVGTVVDVGAQVRATAPGDTVLVTWIPRTAEVDRMPAPSRVPLPGGGEAVTHNVFAWGTHTVVDELFVCPAPASTPMDVGAIIGCAVMTGAGAVLNTAGMRPGGSVAVWGTGGVGLSAVAAARIGGATHVIAVDLAEDKLAQARRFGATATVDGRTEDPVARIHELTGGGVDLVVDCIGRASTVSAGLAAARPATLRRHPGGTVVVVGVPTEPLGIDGLDLVAKEKRLVGCRGGDAVPEQDFPRIVEWHHTGRLDLAALVGRRYPLEEINDAVDDLRHGRIVGRGILELTP